jgi:hypothetical protein
MDSQKGLFGASCYALPSTTSVYTYAALRRLMGDELNNGKR